VSSTVMDFVAVVFMLALLCFFSFDATVFSVNKDLYIIITYRISSHVRDATCRRRYGSCYMRYRRHNVSDTTLAIWRPQRCGVHIAISSELYLIIPAARCYTEDIQRAGTVAPRIKHWHAAHSSEFHERADTVNTRIEMVSTWSYSTLVVVLSVLVVGITSESGHERQKRSPDGYGQPSYHQPKKPSSTCISLCSL